MHRKVYVLEPSKGIVLSGYKERIIHPPSAKPIEISQLHTPANEPLVKLVLQTAKPQSLSIFRALVGQLTGSERASHHLVFTVSDEEAEYKGKSTISIRPDGSISFQADQFALEGQSYQSIFLREYQLQLPTILPRATLVEYSLPLTSDPKRVRKTGYPVESLQKIIDRVLPPDATAFHGEGLELEDFDFRINRTGRYTCDLRVTYAVGEGRETGVVAVYATFASIRRRKERNRTKEAAMFSYFARSFLSVQEHQQRRVFTTLEEQIRREERRNRKL